MDTHLPVHGFEDLGYPMRVSHFTLRSWFRTLMSVSLAWVVFGSFVTHYVFISSGGPSQPSEQAYLQRIQGALASAAETFLTVLSRPPAMLQLSIADLVPKPRESSQMTPEEREARFKALVNEYAQLLGRYEEAEKRIAELVMTHEDFPTVPMVPVNFTGWAPGPSTDAFNIDRGTSQGIFERMAVMKDSSVVGRIQTAGMLVSTALMTTDTRMKIQARLVRGTRDGGLQVIAKSCLIRGTGAGTMACDTINAVDGHAFAPLKGDLLVLADEQWPKGVQHAVLGEVVEVTSVNLVYHLQIVPRVKISPPMNVVVLLQQ